MSLLLVLMNSAALPASPVIPDIKERFLEEERKYIRNYRGRESSGGEETGNVAKDEQEGPVLCKSSLKQRFLDIIGGSPSFTSFAYKERVPSIESNRTIFYRGEYL